MRPCLEVPDAIPRSVAGDASLPTERTAPPGCADVAESQLEGLRAALGWSAPDAGARALLRGFTSTWTQRPRAEGPRFSAVADDGSPYEFSLAFTPGRAELRVLVEAQSEPATAAGYWAAGRALTDSLARTWRKERAPLDGVLDLFVPRGPRNFCALWHGLRFTPGRDPDVRLYLDPHARGPGSAPEVVAEVLERLGLKASRPEVDAVLAGGRLGLGLLALDLGAPSRVKLYFSAPGLTADEVEATVAHAVDAVPGEAREFFRRVLGTDGPHAGPPLRVCFTLDAATGGRLSRPVTDLTVGTLDDSTVTARTREVLRGHGLDVAAYERCLQVMAPAPEAPAQGLHPVLSFQRDRGEPRVTAYLAPRLYLTGGEDTGPRKHALWRAWNA
ncbi:hypothetical protein EJ065_2765 [Corallococcus coralloides]|uniref:Tryptophan dimethylallyltransferase n=1 Tax=Corallococcus coralloides TaxID=184914 RepID=A0A410RR24_CORCK|nr:hypothetical protein [Corallococcus coralloides]QAT84337.1 hypothetical protein EJ065_2765 [Corallococcus coralloides]